MARDDKFEDYTFMERFSNGEINSLNDVYDRYAPLLYGIICKEVQDEKIAAEILGCVFDIAFRNTREFDVSKQRLFTWLHSICLKLLHGHKPLPVKVEQIKGSFPLLSKMVPSYF